MITRGRVFTIVVFVWSLAIPPPISFAMDSLFLPMLVYVVAGKRYLLWFYFIEFIWSIQSLIQSSILGGGITQSLMNLIPILPKSFAPSALSPLGSFVMLILYIGAVYLLIRSTYRQAQRIYRRVPSHRRS